MKLSPYLAAGLGIFPILTGIRTSLQKEATPH
jgi:hypothetical protein